MSETNNIEYKESWRDEYLRQICGLANTHGGSLFIGIDDNGNVIGINKPKKLQEDIPNKVKDTLGIITDVQIRHKDNLDYIEIIVAENGHLTRAAVLLFHRDPEKWVYGAYCKVALFANEADIFYCHAYIVDCKAKYKAISLFQLIEEYNDLNLDNSIKAVKSVSVFKEFRNTNAKVNKDELSRYKIVQPGQLSYVQTTKNEKYFACVVNNYDHLQFEDLKHFMVPVSPIEVQEAIVSIYHCMEEAKSIAREARELMKTICPALIQRAANSN